MKKKKTSKKLKKSKKHFKKSDRVLLVVLILAISFLTYSLVDNFYLREGIKPEVKASINEKEENIVEQRINEEKQKIEEIEVSQPVKENVTKKRLPSSIVKYGITFYIPKQYKKDYLGRMICIHDDDKPKASTKGKPVHQDMECCLDFDEIPNPYCYYPKNKYGKLLDDFDRKMEKMLRRHHEGKGI